MDNRSYFFIGVLVAALLALVFLVDNDNGNYGSYIYVGVDGEEYDFNLTRVGANDRHVLFYDFERVTSPGKTVIVPVSIPFRYSPSELEDIPIEDVKDLILGSEVIYVTRDYAIDEYTNQLDGVAMLTFVRVVDDVMDPDMFRIPTGMAITSPVEGVDSPVVGCDYSNVEARVIELKMGSENRIYMEGDYCVVMEFVESEDSIKVATKLTYHVLGLM